MYRKREDRKKCRCRARSYSPRALFGTSRSRHYERPRVRPQVNCFDRARWIQDRVHAQLRLLRFRGGRKSLTPAQIYSTLEATAVDMDDPFTSGVFDTGFDVGTGYGLVNAAAALQALYCRITFVLFNARYNDEVFILYNGTNAIDLNLPACGWANIEAVVPCGDSDRKVTIELYQGTNRFLQATDSRPPYFLFGNRGRNVKRGKIPAGSYGIRAQVDGIWSPFTNFTLQGSCN